MVLLIDDDEDVREAVGDYLRLLGYDVQTAENGQDALELLTELLPCVVLLDLVMPVMDGWRFLDALRADSRLATLPVVIASAHATTHLPGGVHAVLHKPFDLDRLAGVVEEHCGPPPG